MPERRSWRDISPLDAADLDLSTDLSVDAPLNEFGERCPWPWEPQQLTDVPLGQFHCSYCGAMCLTGLPHPDYAGIDEELRRADIAAVADDDLPSCENHCPEAHLGRHKISCTAMRMPIVTEEDP